MRTVEVRLPWPPERIQVQQRVPLGRRLLPLVLLRLSTVVLLAGGLLCALLLYSLELGEEGCGVVVCGRGGADGAERVRGRGCGSNDGQGKPLIESPA